MKYLAVLGRQPEISQAELESLFGATTPISERLAEFDSPHPVSIERLGGTLKLARPLDSSPLEFLQKLPNGKITLGLSNYSEKSARKVGAEALKLKKILIRHGRKVRVVPNQAPALSTATSFHNHLGSKPNCIELIHHHNHWYQVQAVQNINSYTKRDRERPARDAKVGMLPPKLAQILINLCGPLKPGARIFDPFCGTGVVLQEAALMGYVPYGTDLDERMVKYSRKNLIWLQQQKGAIAPSSGRSSRPSSRGSSLRPRSDCGCPSEGLCQPFCVAQADATTATWEPPIDAVACETYLGKPFDHIPTKVELQPVQEQCRKLILGFLKNIAPQLSSDTPLTLAIPAWLRPDDTYKKLEILDEITKLGYNVKSYASASDLLYHRAGQVVTRQIITLRKK